MVQLGEAVGWEDDRIGSYQQNIDMEIGYGNIMKYPISTYPISME
jgi:hypothetical protein